SETTLQYVNGYYTHGSYKDPIKIYFKSDNIAQIGDKKFSTLAAACEAAQDGETISLIKDATDNGAVINKNITLDFNGKTYTITEGNSIEIAEGGILTVAAEGSMNLEGEGKLVINGGQLYHNIVGINATVKKTFTPQTEQFYWNTISAPIVGGATIPTNATHDLYRYDEVEQEWEYYLDADGVGFSTLELGRGYLYAAGKEDITVELNGVLNVNDVEFLLSYTEGNELAGFNMIGNPFTHNINDSHFSGATLSEGYYVIGENGEWLSRYDGADDIEPMQSVLVKTSEEANVTIKKQATDTRNVSNGSLRIDVTGSNCQDVAYVSFNKGIGLDKISHNNSTSALLYITNKGKNYAVATMSKDVTEIPVAFKAMTMGEYTISVTAQNCEFETLYLIDRLTGKKVNLNMESYSFVATSNDNTNRFVLTTVVETLDIEDNKAEAFVYINNDEIIINNIQGHAQLNIIDMMGRQAARYDVFESAVISTSSLERGVYLIQMTDANGIRTQKILVD
ncbi:MAG: T9SS type A sorting domain-containing protein, partial [Bacteroidales bacterium]|nr:T9SS type A sorting domain-containing protein [Bacteroidales bacterium]